MHRRVQGYCNSAKEWYETNVLAIGAPTDPERIEFARTGDYGNDQNYTSYQTCDPSYEDESGGFANSNGDYSGGMGEYEEFSEGVASHHKISEWQAGWNVTNAIQVWHKAKVFALSDIVHIIRITPSTKVFQIKVVEIQRQCSNFPMTPWKEKSLRDPPQHLET